ncbi:MAG: hypothetical protein PHG66_00900 [Candidatus Colwellbacteria bacterium]|nr:hypothetical protein [Candidatus Colwellbacteria bacterium]
MSDLKEISPSVDLFIMDDCLANTDKTMDLLKNPLIRKIYLEGRHSDLMDPEKWRLWIQQCEHNKELRDKDLIKLI